MSQQRILRLIFLTLMLFAFAFPILIGAVFSWRYYSEQLDAAKSFLKERNEALSGFIDGYFKEIRNILRTLASLPEVAEIPWRDESTKKRTLALFKSLQQFNQNIYYIYSGYIDGSLLINDYEPPPGFDPRRRPWYQSVMSTPRTGNETVGLLYREAKTDELLLATVRILESPERGFTGAVSIDSFTQDISKQIERRSTFYQSAKSFIIDRDGTVLVHPVAEHIGKKLSEIADIDQSLVMPGHYFEYRENATRRIAYLSDIPITGWRLITVVDEGEIVTPIINRLVLYIFWLAAISSILGLILASIWKQRVTAPLTTLVERMKRIANTEQLLISVSSSPKGDEIAEIASNIENMAIQALLQKNTELTQAHKTIEKMVEELSQKNAQLEKMAAVDSLTNILNRRKIEEELDQEYRRYLRHGTPFSLILFDIDHFKSINDTFGHQKGDEVLKELTRLVAQRLRANDCFGRWGGEEFLVLLPNTVLDDALALAKQLLGKVAAHPFSIDRQVTISMGVVEIDRRETIDQLLRRVDDLLYSAKNRGRNQICSGKEQGQ